MCLPEDYLSVLADWTMARHAHLEGSVSLQLAFCAKLWLGCGASGCPLALPLWFVGELALLQFVFAAVPGLRCLGSLPSLVGSGLPRLPVVCQLVRPLLLEWPSGVFVIALEGHVTLPSVMASSVGDVKAFRVSSLSLAVERRRFAMTFV